MADRTNSQDGNDLGQRVRDVVHEGNVRYFRVTKGGRTYIDVPLTLFIIAITAPWLVVLGLVLAAVTGAQIEFGRRDEANPTGLDADIAESEAPDETAGHA